MGMYDKCPCRKCEKPKRHPACHGKCEEYLEWKKTDIVPVQKKIQHERNKNRAIGFLADNTLKMQKLTKGR